MRLCKISLFALLAALGAGCGEDAISSQQPAADSSSPGSQTGSSSGNSSAPAAAAHHRCGWIEQVDPTGVAAFVAHAGWYDEIHPFWFHLTADGSQILPYASVDSAPVVAAAHANHVRLMPLVFFDDVGGLRAMLSNPAARAQKAAELVAIAEQHHYDGLEIDFEQLFDAGDRAGYMAFMSALAQGLHAAGLRMSAAVPALGTQAISENANAYDYAGLTQLLDRIHLMAYDFHGVFHNHAGPIAPLGWVRDVLEHVKQTGKANLFTLGLANYSVTPGLHRTAADAQHLCGGAGAYAATTDHMASCPFGNYEAGRAPNCTIGGALTFFEDAGSIAEKVELAKQYGVGGVAYYPLGGEQSDLLATFARYY